MPTQETKSPSKTRNPKSAVPAYRQRAGYSQAIVTLTDAETRQRRDYWLGEFDQPESRERYHRVVAVLRRKEFLTVFTLALRAASSYVRGRRLGERLAGSR